jgi:hypothetical protein
MTDFNMNGPPVIQVWYENDTAPAVDVSMCSGQSIDGNQFFLDSEIWHYNIKTKNYFAEGTYTVFMDSGDTTEHVNEPGCEGVFLVE